MVESSKETVKAPKAEKPAKKAEVKPKAEDKIIPTAVGKLFEQSSKKSAKTEAPKAASSAAVINAWSVLKSPYLTEKSTHMIESQNKLVFIVADRATKAAIKKAVEAAFGVKVSDVNTTSTMRGEKKAYVRLKPEFKAIDIATKLGMM